MNMNLRKLREFYRISEVAEEWGCSIEDVLYLGLEGKLPLLVLVSNCKAAGMLSRLGERKPACFSLDKHMEIMRNDLAAIAARGESETRYLMFTFPDREVRDKYQRIMGEFIELDNPLRISISELWMHKNDKEYIEQLQREESPPAPAPERESGKETPLKVLATLARLYIAEKGPRFGTPEDPNIQALADAIRESAEGQRGFSDRNIRQMLTDAFALIEPPKPKGPR